MPLLPSASPSARVRSTGRRARMLPLALPLLGVLLATQLLAGPPLAAQAAPAGRDALGDSLPQGALARLGTQRLRLDNDAMSVAFTADGKRVRAIDITGEVRVWDATSGELLGTYSAGPEPVRGFQVSPDDSRIAISRMGPGASVIDAASGALVFDLAPHGERAAFSPDGRWLAAWGPPFSKVDLLDPVDGSLRREVNEEATVFPAVAFSPDGSLVAISGLRAVDERNNLGLLFVHDTASGELVHDFELPGVTLLELAFSPDATRLAAGDDNGTIRLWDPRSGELLAEIAGPGGGVRGLTWSPDGRILASTAPAGERPATGTGLDAFTLHDPRSLAVQRVIRGHFADVSGVAFTLDGQRMASSSRDHLIRLWDVNSGARLLPTPGHETGVSGVDSSADGAIVLTAGNDGQVGIWNGGSWTLKKFVPAQQTSVLALACSPDGRLAASSGLDGAVLLHATGSGAEISGWVGAPTHAARGLCFSPDGRSLASAEEDGKIRVRDVSAAIGATQNLEADVTLALGKPVHELDSGGAIAFTVAWSPDGKWLATGSSRLRIFDAATGEMKQDIKGTSPIATIAWSPDGTTVATANADRTVRTYEAATGKALGTASGHPGRVKTVAYSRDGSTLASASDGETVIRLWNASTLAPLGTLTGHTGAVYGIDCPAPGVLVSASVDGTALVWRLGSAGK